MGPVCYVTRKMSRKSHYQIAQTSYVKLSAANRADNSVHTEHIELWALLADSWTYWYSPYGHPRHKYMWILMPENQFGLLLIGFKFDQYDTDWKKNYLEHCTIVPNAALFSNKTYWYFSYFCNENICCWYSLEVPQQGVPQQGASNE